jgi:hypothetical protein
VSGDRLARIKARREQDKYLRAWLEPGGGYQPWARSYLADQDWMIREVERQRAENERLRNRLAWYEEEKSTCRVCGEPISKMSSQWWHDETTRDHDAQPSAPAAELPPVTDPEPT